MTSTYSVIIPAYNAASVVRRAIESVLVQTIAPLEVLVIDDGSQDTTAEIVASYPPPVHVIRKENGGPNSARNLGASAARGEWLAFLDADDSWRPEKLECQLPYGEDTSVAVVHAMAVDTRGLPTPPCVSTFDELWRANHIMTSSVLLRRSVFHEVGGFDQDRAIIGAEDYNLWLRIAAAGYRIVLCPEALFLRSPAPDSLTSQFERCLEGQLANIEKLRLALNLGTKTVRDKRRQTYHMYGTLLFHRDNFRGARRCFLASCREFPSLQGARWLVATWLPHSAIRAGRRLLAVARSLR